MNLVTIEPPAARITAARKAFELLDAALGVVAAGKLLEVVADQLVETLAQGLGFLPGASDQLLVNREGHIHQHSICAHLGCVKDRWRGSQRMDLYENAKLLAGRG
jgi:hypothetical protein